MNKDFRIFKFFLLLFVFQLIYSCTKDVVETKLETQFVIDSLLFNATGTDIYYKIEVNGGNPPYEYLWIRPSENTGKGSFHTKVIGNYGFSVNVKDAATNQNTISYFYDYRDKIIGKYQCLVNMKSYGPIYNVDTTYIDTFEVIKQNTDEINFLSTNFSLDSNWSFYGFYAGPHHTIAVNFLPSKDSLFANTMDGGLGAGLKFNYRGVKIQDKYYLKTLILSQN